MKIATCTWHSDRETNTACGRCDRLICTLCVVNSPIGVVCPECWYAPKRRSKFSRGKILAAIGVITLVGIVAAMMATGLITMPESFVSVVPLSVDTSVPSSTLSPASTFAPTPVPISTVPAVAIASPPVPPFAPTPVPISTVPAVAIASPPASTFAPTPVPTSTVPAVAIASLPASTFAPTPVPTSTVPAVAIGSPPASTTVPTPVPTSDVSAVVIATPTAPSGKIAFSSNRDGDDHEIYVMNADGSDVRRLTNNLVQDIHPAWSPDGQRIAFSSSRGGGISAIHVMNADGSDVRRLTNNSVRWGYHPSWSPDGQRIAFSSGADTYVMNSDGSDVMLLTDNPPGEGGVPSWSPDGQRIAFDAEPGGVDEIYVMNADGSDVTLLTDGFRKTGQHPAWSPDGQQIAFESSSYADSYIYVMNADGSEVKRLTRNSEHEDTLPAWSPDSQWIAFVSFRDYTYKPGDGNLGEIYVMKADGSDVRRITDNSSKDSSPSWSPESVAPSSSVPAPVNTPASATTQTSPSTAILPTRVPHSQHLGITMEATEAYFSNLGFIFGPSIPDKLGVSKTGRYKSHNIQIVGDGDVKLIAYIVEKTGNRTDDEVMRLASTVIGVVLPDCDECGKWFEANLVPAFNNNIGASTVIQGIEIKFDTTYPTHFVLSVRAK